MHFEKGDILITNGGSEALQITMNCILDDGDEILIPEPFYPNYIIHLPILFVPERFSLPLCVFPYPCVFSCL